MHFNMIYYSLMAGLFVVCLIRRSLFVVQMEVRFGCAVLLSLLFDVYH